MNVPPGTESIVCIPVKYKSVTVNGDPVYQKKAVSNDLASFLGMEDGYNRFKVDAGAYSFAAR